MNSRAGEKGDENIVQSRSREDFEVHVHMYRGQLVTPFGALQNSLRDFAAICSLLIVCPMQIYEPFVMCHGHLHKNFPLTTGSPDVQ